MNEAERASADVSAIVARIEQVASAFVAGLYERGAAIRQAPADFEALRESMALGSTSILALLLQIVLVVALAVGGFAQTTYWMNRRAPQRGFWRTMFSVLVAAIVAIFLGLLAARLLGGTSLVARNLRAWVIVAVAGCLLLMLVRAILMESRHAPSGGRSARMEAMVRDISIAISWAIMGIALIATLKLWGAAEGLIDLVGVGLVGIPAYILFATMVWRHRRTMAAAVAGPRPRSRWRSRLARNWPTIVITFLIITFLSSQTAIIFGRPLPGAAVLMTTLVVLATPHLDALISHWARQGLESTEIAIASAAGRQTARFAALVIVIAVLATLWSTPLAIGFGLDLRSVAHESFGVALIALAAAFLWNVIGAVVGRAQRMEAPAAVNGEDDEATDAPRSRLGTLLPLLSGVAKSSILALAILSILVSLGVNVWPLITGLSVFGLAIGFGSQALVKDVVSGLFFLIDDAFRFGEYIQTAEATGNVEKISIRSVSLRDSRGTITTVPYGQIGMIKNFSRDWVIDKLTFRLAFDTDVEKVRKVFKKIGQEIAADPALAGDLIEPLKSQGIAEVEDGTLVIRAKFKAKAGKQYLLRRATLKAIHRAFIENGIKAVAKTTTLTTAPSPGA